MKEIGDDDAALGNLDEFTVNKQLMQLRKTNTSSDTDELKYFRRLHVFLDKSSPVRPLPIE